MLSPGGVLLFATLGPDTLKELREAWTHIDSDPHVHEFVDMHQLGDGMLAAGLIDPVVDAEWLSVEYETPLQLMRDLKGIGESNAIRRRADGLRGRDQLETLQRSYPLQSGGRGIAATYEIVYGHAWGSSRLSEAAQVKVAFDPQPR